MRYFISIIIILCGFILSVLLNMNGLLSYLDLHSFILVGLFPFLFVSTLIGFKKMKSAFLIFRNKKPEKDTLMQALHFFKTYGKATWITGLIALMIEAIGILTNLEDAAALGPNLAYALLCPFYSGLINMVIVMPYTVFIKKQKNVFYR